MNAFRFYTVRNCCFTLKINRIEAYSFAFYSDSRNSRKKIIRRNHFSSHHHSDVLSQVFSAAHQEVRECRLEESRKISTCENIHRIRLNHDTLTPAQNILFRRRLLNFSGLASEKKRENSEFKFIVICQYNNDQKKVQKVHLGIRGTLRLHVHQNPS